MDDTLLIPGGLFIWSYIFCMSVQIFLSPLSRQQFLRDLIWQLNLASLMREHDCTECSFDIFLLKNRFLEWLALLQVSVSYSLFLHVISD